MISFHFRWNLSHQSHLKCTKTCVSFEYWKKKPPRALCNSKWTRCSNSMNDAAGVTRTAAPLGVHRQSDCGRWSLAATHTTHTLSIYLYISIWAIYIYFECALVVPCRMQVYLSIKRNVMFVGLAVASCGVHTSSAVAFVHGNGVWSVWSQDEAANEWLSAHRRHFLCRRCAPTTKFIGKHL